MQNQLEARKEEIRAKVREVIALGEKKLGVTLPKIDIRFDLRGRSAGVAGYRGSNFYVRFNVGHLQLGGQTYEHILENTVSHEIAHSFCQAFPKFGRNHDAGWKRVCLALGGNGRRCYDEDDAPEAVAAQRPYVYITTHGHEVRVTKVMHTKIQKGASYTAKGKGQLTRQCQFNYMSAPTADKPLVLTGKNIEIPMAKPKAAPKERAVAAGGQSNASLIRSRIAQAKARGETMNDVILFGIQALGMTKALATTYVRNNWDKV